MRVLDQLFRKGFGEPNLFIPAKERHYAGIVYTGYSGISLPIKYKKACQEAGSASHPVTDLSSVNKIDGDRELDRTITANGRDAGHLVLRGDLTLRNSAVDRLVNQHIVHLFVAHLRPPYAHHIS